MLTKELTSLVSSESGLSKKDTERLLATTTAILRENIMAGKTVQLQGLGALEMKARGERTIVHPKTGERTIVPSKNQLVFKPATNLKEEIKKF
jgi:nucleoid DNA-binding protein